MILSFLLECGNRISPGNQWIFLVFQIGYWQCPMKVFASEKAYFVAKEGNCFMKRKYQSKFLGLNELCLIVQKIFHIIEFHAGFSHKNDIMESEINLEFWKRLL